MKISKLKRRLAPVLAVVCLLSWLAGRAYSADDASHFRLVQIIGTSALQDRIDAAASDGYRLLSVLPEAETIVAMFEKVSSPAARYEYACRELKKRKIIGKGTAEDLNLLANELEAQGFHLHTILGPEVIRPGVYLGSTLVVAEKPPGPAEHYEYTVLKQGVLHGFNQKDVDSVAAAGYHLDEATEVTGAFLIVRRASAADRGAPAPPGDKDKPAVYRLLHDHRFYPEKSIRQAAAEGNHVVYLGFEMANARLHALVEPNPDGSALYQYRFVKPSRKFGFHEEDFNKAGGEGFRLLPLGLTWAGWGLTMEKAPGQKVRYEYRLADSPRLADVSEEVAEADQDGFHFAAMIRYWAGVIVIMEKASPAGGE